jgi:hypothetical protein
MNQQLQTVETEVAGQRALFDYGALDQETQVLVRLRAGEIKSLAKRVASDIVEIGGKLAEVKDRVGGNGKFSDWLSAELGWSDRTAHNFIAVWQKFNAANFALENVATSALYLLAAPSTPAEAVEAARQIADSGEKVTHGVAKEIVRQAKEKRPKQVELMEEPEEALEESEAAEVGTCRICGCTDADCRQCVEKTGEPCHWVEEDLCSACVGATKEAKPQSAAEEEPRRPMDQLVATVKRFSGRIVGSTLVNQGFTFGQVTEALDRKLIEKRNSSYLWYVEPAPAADVAEAVDPLAICLCGCKAGDHTREDGEFAECTKCECEVFQGATETEIAERKATEKALGIEQAAPVSKASPAPVSAQKPAASKRPTAWFKSRIEITITLMPGSDEATRKVMHSVRAGDGMPFVQLTTGEDDLVGALPVTTLGLYEKAAEAFAKKPAAKPAAKPAKKPTTKSKPPAKKPAAKTKAKAGKK